MSKVMELAEAEAEQHEGDEPETPEAPAELEENAEGEDATTPSPTPEPEPETPESAEQSARAFVSELKRHEKATAKALNLEPDALVVCGVCAGSGFLGGGTEVEQKMALEQGIAVANQWVAAHDPAREYAPREDVEPCKACKALGMMTTGSRVPGQDILPCNKCNGAGYVTKIEPFVPPVQTNGTTTPTHADAEAQRLRELGYTVVPPYVPNTTASA